MTHQVKIKIRSRLDHGTIIIDNDEQSLAKKDYLFDFSTDKPTVGLFVLKGLKPGLNQGVEILSCEINGYPVPDPEKFTSFQMTDNPFVENKTIVEKIIFFNGALDFVMDIQRLGWFPFYYSTNRLDFVNNTQNYQANVPYDPHIRPTANSKMALGCSQTYGWGMDNSYAWPALLGYDNYGVPGLGVDGIFYNAKRLIESFQPQRMIIMFPNLERRLLEFERRGHFFKIPILVDESEGLLDRDFYWIRGEELKELAEETRKKIVKDEDNAHSKKFLQMISALPCDIWVSSWDRQTYDILPRYFKNVLPYFEKFDRASDDVHHGPKSHEKWAKNVKNHNI